MLRVAVGTHPVWDGRNFKSDENGTRKYAGEFMFMCIVVFYDAAFLEEFGICSLLALDPKVYRACIHEMRPSTFDHPCM
jgi:hypothetical protein